MLPTHQTEPTGSTPVQNVILTSEVVEVAGSVATWVEFLYNEIDIGYAPTHIDFEFLSRTNAERAEHLFCKIVATSNPDIVDEDARGFPGYVDQQLQPLIQSLNAIEAKALKDDPGKSIVKKLQLHRQKLEKFSSRAVELADELKMRLQSQSWEMVAVAWVGLNDFNAKTVRLHNAFARQESKWHRFQKITPSRPPRIFVHNTQFSQVARIENGVRVAYKPLLLNKLTGFCGIVASAWNRNGALGVTADQKEIVFAYDELINQCSPLRPDLYEDDQIQKFITTQGRFCKLMKGLLECEIAAEAEEVDSSQSVMEATAQDAIVSEEELPRYMLREEQGVWEVICDGKRCLIKDGRGMKLVACLLKHPPAKPIHASVLESRVSKYGKTDVGSILAETALSDPDITEPSAEEADGKYGEQNMATVDLDAVIQEGSLDTLDTNARKIIEDQIAELLNTINDPTMPESQIAHAEEALSAAKKSLNMKATSQANDAVGRVSKALSRLHKSLKKDKIKSGEPNKALLAFGEHLEKYILRPSSSHSKTEYPGCFTYEPLSGVVWAD